MRVYMQITENLSPIQSVLLADTESITIELHPKSENARVLEFDRRELLNAIKIVATHANVKVGIMPLRDSYNTSVYEVSVDGNTKSFVMELSGKEYAFEMERFCDVVNLL